jgi:hypothetical protein
MTHRKLVIMLRKFYTNKTYVYVAAYYPTTLEEVQQLVLRLPRRFHARETRERKLSLTLPSSIS